MLFGGARPRELVSFFIFNLLICNVIYKFSLLHLHADVDNYMLSHMVSLCVCWGFLGGAGGGLILVISLKILFLLFLPPFLYIFHYFIVSGRVPSCVDLFLFCYSVISGFMFLP